MELPPEAVAMITSARRLWLAGSDRGRLAEGSAPIWCAARPQNAAGVRQVWSGGERVI